MTNIRTLNLTPGTDMGTVAVERSGQTATTTASSYRLPPVVSGLPRITGGQFQEDTAGVDTTGLTGITAYAWEVVEGAALGTSVTQSLAGIMGAIRVTVTCDQGTLVSPPIYVYMGMASHDADDARVLAAVPHHKATHIAVQDGPWNTASTWLNNRVPRYGARVLIPRGISVTYDNQTVGVRLDWVRIDGAFISDLTKSVTMLFESLIVTRGATLADGTSAQRRAANTSSDYVVSSVSYQNSAFIPSALDFEGDDNNLIGRGIINQGTRRMWGAMKTPWLRTAFGNAPEAGDTQFVLASSPTGWQVGDTIAVGGTGTDAAVNETEEVIITAIRDATVFFTPGLTHDHKVGNVSVTRNDLQPAVANLNRNITIRSENPDVPDHMRGHTMDMHMHCWADIWDVEHVGLGRTRKRQDISVFADIVGRQDGSDFWHTDASNSLVRTPMTADSNVKSRYPVHLHINGANKARKDIYHSCVVRGTPGWAMVHHGGEGFFISNVVCGFDGAGMVGESADETGDWVGNLIMKATSKDATSTPKVSENVQGLNGNFARNGEAFYMRGRAIRVNSNYAMDSSWGFTFFHRASNVANVVSPFNGYIRSRLDIKDLQPFRSHYNMSGPDYPIIHANNNEVAGMSRGGIFVSKGSAWQGHGWNVNIKNFKCWNFGGYGIFLEYIAQYAITDLDATGGAQGMHVGTNLAQVAIVRPHTERCGIGVLFDNSGENFPNDDWDAVNNPKYMLVEHTSVSDNTAVQYDNDADLVTKVFATDPTPVELTTDLPFRLAAWNGGTDNDTSITGSVTGTFSDTASNAGLIPKVQNPSGHPFNSTIPGAVSPALIRGFVQEYGYWTVDGVNYVIDAYYYGDRITGVPLKKMHGIEFTGNTFGLTNNGAYAASANAPVVGPASLMVAAGQSASLDLLALAFDVDGGTLYIDPSFQAPDHGRLVINGAVVTYEADENYTGSDIARLWVADLVGTDAQGRNVAGYLTRVDLDITVT